MNMTTLNVMPLRTRLDREKKKSGLTFETVQQDYLLSWVLSGLCEHPLLKEKLIFKGGTALKKCYFGNYRFSEDLDFSVISSIPRREKLLAAVIEACKNAEQKMNEFAEIRLVVERYEEKDDHPFEQEAFKVRAQFPWHREPLTSAKIEITMQETVLFPPMTKQIIHPYDERIDTPIIKHIQQHGKISAMEAEKLWKLTRRTATNRLKKMCQEGLLVELSTGPFDPYKIFILAEPRNQPRKT